MTNEEFYKFVKKCEQSQRGVEALEKKYDDGYQKGLEDAWELAGKVVLEYEDGGMPVLDSDECFEIGNYYKILKGLSAFEAKAKYEAWKAKKVQTVETIPIEWIEDWLSDRSILWDTPSETSIKQMITDWQAEQEKQNDGIRIDT